MTQLKKEELLLMNNDFVKNVSRDINQKYNLNLLSYYPVSSKSYKVIDINKAKYLVKKTKSKIKDKYDFLKNEGVKNIIYPLSNIKGDFSTRFNENICEEGYCVLPYIDDSHVLNETKVKALLEELSYLHDKTSFYRKLSVTSSKKKIDEILGFLDYKFSLIESYIRTIEAQPFDEYSIPVLKNYQYILDAKKLMIKYNMELIKAIKEEKSVMYCFLHNNPKLEHLLINNGNKYLISIDNGVIGICSLDLAKFYLENKDVNIDISELIKLYLKKYDDDFYYNYFIYLVFLILITGINIDNKNYVSTQSFIYCANSIKKFIKDFDLTAN